MGELKHSMGPDICDLRSPLLLVRVETVEVFRDTGSFIGVTGRVTLFFLVAEGETNTLNLANIVCCNSTNSTGGVHNIQCTRL